MSIPLHTRQKLREASQEQPGATRYGPSTIARWRDELERERFRRKAAILSGLISNAGLLCVIVWLALRLRGCA